MIQFLKRRLSLTISLVLFVIGVLIATFVFIGIITLILHYLGISSTEFLNGMDRRHTSAIKPLEPLLKTLAVCVLLGTALTGFLSKRALEPIRKIADATQQVAEGNFDVQVEIKGIRELEELSHSFNKMTNDLAGIETLRQDFINNFSHEFKTPIVSIRGFAKILKNSELTEAEKKEYLDIIISESDRLAALSTNILTLSKYENMNIVSETDPFPLDEQIRRTIVLMEPKWSSKEITINVDLDPVTLLGNEDILQQIWLNLLDNSIKFSDHQGTIDVRLAESEEDIIFTLRDNGQGMNRETAAHIFDKFYQGDSSRSKAGNGLGLALVKRIVELCRGTIEVESQPGSGSSFTVRLPNIKLNADNGEETKNV